MKVKLPSKTITAIIAIAILLAIALIKNIDGALLASGITVIAGLGGYAVAKKTDK